MNQAKPLRVWEHATGQLIRSLRETLDGLRTERLAIDSRIRDAEAQLEALLTAQAAAGRTAAGAVEIVRRNRRRGPLPKHTREAILSRVDPGAPTTWFGLPALEHVRLWAALHDRGAVIDEMAHSLSGAGLYRTYQHAHENLGNAVAILAQRGEFLHTGKGRYVLRSLSAAINSAS